MTRDAFWRRGVPPYPDELNHDPQPPEVLYVTGDPTALDARRVAIVGTRRCTAYGRRISRRLGAELSEAGVAVISGLAIGIDGAAHEGALDAGGRPIGVVASGLDVVYPRRHASLWERVARSGLLMSEVPAGTQPRRSRFPERNRIIAALAEIVIVVESAAKGGSMHTVNAAMERGVTVMAVPGPVGSAASEGTNRLLVDGVAPVLTADEVLLALGLATAGRLFADPPLPKPRLSRVAKVVIEELDFVPTTTEHLLSATGIATGELTVALQELKASGLADGGGGWWSRLPRN